MKLILEQHSILVESHDFIEDQDIAEWLRTSLESIGGRIVEFSIGADRAQWLIDIDGIMLILFYEALSESLWFELLQENQKDMLPSIVSRLS